MQGSIKVNHATKHSMIGLRFDVQNFNADKYDYSLFSSLSKMQWLKNLKYDVNIRASINDFTLNDTKVEDLGFLLKIKKSRLVADKRKLSGKDHDTTGNILVDQKYIKPLLDVNLTGNKFNGSIF
ncbi:hypothetical protein GOM44_04055 [Wolbachia endosymbiont of Atemnus politus]|uniref:hypothetical protein n=1 Tax=Wolbachia endosymbiont of Atemnus politus TaxID=2682840 RepID=UPI001571B1CD|nr:hypothetical protein [Wolbachia endosymbiont of Atemnus politus]